MQQDDRTDRWRRTTLFVSFKAAATVVAMPAAIALWLFLAALPVLADGGPHIMAYNNGSQGINADSCAGCHRIHSATSSAGGYLLGNNASTISGTTYSDVNDFCLSCHSSTGFGATTDVETGVQYKLASGPTRGDGTTIWGALRSGGFVTARIGTASAQRYRFRASGTLDFETKVPVGPSGAATSAHLAVSGSSVATTGITWGYSATGDYLGTADPGKPFANGLECTSCHNPHGNGQYRTLIPIPSDGTVGGVQALVPAPVYDAPLPPANDTRNYTVIQTAGVQGNYGTYLLYTSQLGPYSSTAGDYFHRWVPWTSANGALDAPNGWPQNRVPAGSTSIVKGFNTQMTAWCSACHTRYYNSDGPSTATGDPIYSYQHATNVSGTPACTVCHVAHGSNAVMNSDPTKGTTYSADELYPGQTTLPPAKVGDSRLLKIDNRGTCLACHDPTNTVAVGTYQGPSPNPVVP